MIYLRTLKSELNERIMMEEMYKCVQKKCALICDVMTCLPAANEKALRRGRFTDAPEIGSILF